MIDIIKEPQQLCKPCFYPPPRRAPLQPAMPLPGVLRHPGHGLSSGRGGSFERAWTGCGPGFSTPISVPTWLAGAARRAAADRMNKALGNAMLKLLEEDRPGHFSWEDGKWRRPLRPVPSPVCL